MKKIILKTLERHIGNQVNLDSEAARVMLAEEIINDLEKELGKLPMPKLDQDDAI
tara:strand:+ start:728 stop:892 length:165 start_codon:yes stop_codon:yes gene_type:complete